MRLAIAAALCACAGCLSGLDEGPLTNGNRSDFAQQADGGFAPCDDFSNDRPGVPPSGWNQLVGMWSVVQVASGHALAQIGAPDNVLNIIREGQNWQNLDVTASVDTGGTTDCVLARLLDAGNYYALCLANRTAWTLEAHVGGVATILDQGTHDPGSGSYTLDLKVIASQLTGSISGFPVTTQSDSQIDRGAVGVGTRGLSDFPKVCVDLHP